MSLIHAILTIVIILLLAFIYIGKHSVYDWIMVKLKSKDAIDLKRVKVQLSILNNGEKILQSGSWDWDMTKKPDVVNYTDNFAKIFHVPYDGQMTAKELMDVVHIEDRGKVNDKLEEVFKNGGSYSVDYRIVMRNGRVDLIHANGVVLKNNNNKTIRIYGTITLLKRNVG